MLSLDAAGVLACSAGFRPEACGPRADFDRQCVGVERLLAMEAGELDFASRREPEIGALDVKHFIRKFRELADACE